jgi:branched-subunit amino acid ABC-type transport system permease component
VLTGFVYSNDILFAGIVDGFVYALVAFGLLLIFRATGVINFAQGQIGAFGGYAMALLYIRYDIPYGLSFPLAILSGVVLGVAAELILRRLFTQPRLLLFVATLGITQLILFLQLRLPIPEEEAQNVQYPVLIDGRWRIGFLSVTVEAASVCRCGPPPTTSLRHSSPASASARSPRRCGGSPACSPR